MANAIAEPPLCYEVDASAQELLEVNQEATKIEEASAGLEIHQQVNVAVGVGVAACGRTEDADVACPSCGSGAENWDRQDLRIGCVFDGAESVNLVNRFSDTSTSPSRIVRISQQPIFQFRSSL